MIDWTHWHNEPYLIGGLIFLGWLYALATGPWRARFAPVGTPYPSAAACCFYGGLLCFYLAVGSPLDQIAERYLLSAHMLQHQLIIYPAAILFLRGLPDWLLHPICGHRHLRRPLGLLVHPLVGGTIYVGTISVWHAPALYDWALRSRPVHILEHFVFFGSALLFWWPLISRSRDLPPLRPAWRMLYLLGITLGMTPLFAFLAFSTDILYPTYEFAPRLTSLTPAADQLLGAAMMKLIGFAVSFGAFGVAFYEWYQNTENPSRHP
ncbi:MAG: cytochrome c oxidase assembly protein [Opitutae bacterium]|nr:cytochrome c oxidase assembly protein [Opitutae bacterium]